MGINLDKPHKWKKDIATSVDMYNKWFMTFAPQAFKNTRNKTVGDVINAIQKTDNLKNISSNTLLNNPEILPTLRMSTCPPIAVDRLIGLSGVKPGLVKNIEKNVKLPAKFNQTELEKICSVINRLLDKDIFAWLDDEKKLNEHNVERAATIIADRLCGSMTNPIIRNAQEKRQLELIKSWLEKRGYNFTESSVGISPKELSPGSFTFHFNVRVNMDNAVGYINIPIDCAIKTFNSDKESMPLLIEAKSAGDYANVNKRRKEEAQKMSQLKATYGDNIKFILFLCGYFDCGYLGYEAAEGIDWIWEHSVDDLQYFL